jgi:enoyl-CoA hydratase
MADFATLQVERRDGYAVVRLDRPPVNAVNRTMMRELRTCFDHLSQQRDVAAVLLGACGDRAFCAGIDLKELASKQTTPPTAADLRTVLDPHWEWRQAQQAIRNCLVPVVAVVEGAAIGAGFGLVGVCDLVIAGDQARFGLTEINVGVLGGASKAIRLLGPSKARRMLFLGELLAAHELYRLGGIEEVVAAGAAETRAREIAAELATKSPIGLRLAKESILRIEGEEMMERYRTENDYTDRLRRFHDSDEAVAAYNEKRDPRWSWS